jgi:tetratricopeptide (TPR) repeat protein
VLNELKLLRNNEIMGSIKWNCLKDYAELLKDYGYYMKSLIQYERVLMMVQENRLFNDEAFVCYQIAQLNVLMDNDFEALTYYQHSLSILSNLPYKELALKCFDGFLGIIERQILMDEESVVEMVTELCTECSKFGFLDIARF